MFPTRLQRLLFLLIICNYKASSNNLESNLRSTRKNHINKIINRILNSNIHPRVLQQACSASTCPENLSIPIRVIPKQDKLTDAETLLTSCSLPLSVKKFKQKGKEMFTSRVCFENIAVLTAIQKQNTTIETVEGGTKTSKNDKLRHKPKIPKTHVDCNGGCCKNCTDHKVKTVVLTTTNYDAISSIVDGCVIGEMTPTKLSIESVEKYLFDMCRNDKHILRSNENVILLKTYRDRNFYKCKGRCDTSQVLDVTVLADKQGMEYAQECAYAESFDPNAVTQEGDSYSTSMKICTNDRLNLYKMKGVDSVLPVCGINNTFALSCGAKWDKAAPVCCDGLECNGVRCMDKSKTDGGTDGTCKKACSAEEAINVNVVVKAEENNSLGSTIGGILGSIGNVLGIGSVSQDASQLIEACTVSKTGEPVPNEEAKTMTYPISICSEDKPALQANPNILSVDEGTVDKGKTEAPTEACEEGTCCKRCVDSNDPTQTMTILVDVESGKGSTFLRSCITSELNQVTTGNEDGKTWTSTICREDFDVVKSNPYVSNVQEDPNAADASDETSTNSTELEDTGDTNSTDTDNTVLEDTGDTNSTDTQDNTALEDTSDTNSTDTDNTELEDTGDTNSTYTDNTEMEDTGDTNSTDTQDNAPIVNDPMDNSTDTNQGTSLNLEQGSASPQQDSQTGLEDSLNDPFNSTDTLVDVGNDQCGTETCCKKCSPQSTMAKPGEPQPSQTDITQIISVLVTTDSFDANNLLQSCGTKMNADVYQNEQQQTVYPMTICRDDYSTIENSNLVLDIQTDTTSFAADASPQVDTTDTNNSTSTDGDTNEACGVTTCCKSCTTSDIISKPGEEQQPETDVSKVISVLVSSTMNGFSFLQSCATALLADIDESAIASGNQVFSITICKDDYTVIENHSEILGIEEGTLD